MLLRASLALASLTALGFTTAPAIAQDDDSGIRSQLQACAQIADITARVGCYDALSQEAAGPPARPADPQPRGLGSEQVSRAPATQRERDDSATAASMDATVTSAAEREPGKYLLTLADGAQWEFVEGVPLSYSPPRRGSTVEIRSASMGSYLLRYQGQAAVRVRRIR